MKVQNLIFTLSLFSSLSLATPLLDVANTVVAMDKSKAALDIGEITFHITRTDDLINDENDNKILLERISHVMVNIQLDNEGLLINGDYVSLADEEIHTAKLVIIKAEALVLPEDTPSAILTAEEVSNLASQLSPGIVSLEVRVESELAPSPTLEMINEEGEITTAVIDGVRVRRVGVFVKINEVEGFNIAHSSLLYAPILQLLVSYDSVDGNRITRISTLAVNGQAPIAAKPAPFIPDSLPPLLSQDDEPTSDEDFPPVPAPSFFGWLASIFGFHPPPPHRFGKGPCQRFRQNVTGEEFQHHNGSEGGHHHRHHHHWGHPNNGTFEHFHGHHRPLMCAFGKIFRGIGFLVLTVWNTLIVKVILGVALGWALGVVLHRRRKNLKSSVANNETSFTDSYTDDKKSVLFSDYSDETETLPVYEETDQTLPMLKVVVPEESKI